jgi:hypothetical protein
LQAFVRKGCQPGWQGTHKKLCHFRFVFATVRRVSVNIPLWLYVKSM